MKTKPTFRGMSTLTIGQRIDELPVIDDIDSMLRDNVSTGDVARFIHLGLEEMTDVKFESLRRTLEKRRKELKPIEPDEDGEREGRLASIVSEEPRRVSRLTRNMYNKTHVAMDRMIELEAIYLAQRDRVDKIILMENEMGYPFEITDRAILTAVKVLEEHGKQEKILMDNMDAGPSHEKLSIKGYSEETVATLRKPDSRRRVVSIVERLKRVKGGKEIPGLKEATGE